MGRGAAARSITRRNSKRAGILDVSCWLALILVAAKAASIEKPRGLVTLAMVSWHDVVFALACGAFGELVVRALRRWPIAAVVVRTTVVWFFAACALYAVAAIGLFRYFHRPLTFDLLGLIGNAATVRSSVAGRITPALALALVAAPLTLLALSRVKLGARVRAPLFAALALWALGGCAFFMRYPLDEDQEFLWLSPHTELLRTTAARLTGRARPAFPNDFPPEYANEFRTIAARGDAATRFLVPRDAARPRNAIVVVLESVGTKYLHLYGSALEVTPNLSAAAENALVFENIYAHASFTYCSFRAINFSVYPGLPWHYALLGDARPLPRTLAAAMQTGGARTAFFTSGDLDWSDHRWLLERSGGFGRLAGAADLGCPVLSSWGTEDRCAFERLLGWIDERPDAPFFAICWTDQTHDPFVASAKRPPIDLFAEKQPARFAADLSRYLNNLHEADAQLGRLLAALRERGLADDTLVVVTGDHGEAFASPHGQRGHAWSVYEEEVHVPLLIWNPRLFPRGERVATIGGHVDLNPTLADVLGVEPAGEWQGYSLFDRARPPRAYFMAIAGGNVFGVREGDWKYIYDVTSARESLFNLAHDPEEQHDLSAVEAAHCADLRRRVAAWVTFEDAFLWGREN